MAGEHVRCGAVGPGSESDVFRTGLHSLLHLRGGMCFRVVKLVEVIVFFLRGLRSCLGWRILNVFFDGHEPRRASLGVIDGVELGLEENGDPYACVDAFADRSRESLC